MERSSLYQLTALKKIFVLLPEIHNINFSFILKFINPSFLFNINFPFVQSSCFYNNFFLSKKLVSWNHFKRPKANLITRQNVKLNQRIFFSDFSGVKHYIWLFYCHHISLETGSGTWILPKPKKVVSILTETHIKHDQIHHTTNNWFSLIFFSWRYKRNAFSASSEYWRCHWGWHWSKLEVYVL